MTAPTVDAEDAALVRYSVTPEDLVQVRQQIGTCTDSACTDQMVQQFIQATGGDLTLTVKRLKATLEWRANVQPQNMTCPACQQQPKSHYMHLVGYDLIHRPVIYSCFEMIANRSIEDNRCHIISMFEQCIQAMPPGVGQWVWVSDFKGFGLSDCHPRLAHTFLELSSAHYPERLGTFMVVGAPWMFNGLWRALQPFIDPVTRQKIKVLPYDVTKQHPEGKVLAAAFDGMFDKELSSWLLAEMEQNRDKHVGPNKKESDAVKNPKLLFLEAEAYFRKDKVEGHDIRGTSRIQELFREKPQLLMAFTKAN